jgi:hypothetical protein
MSFVRWCDECDEWRVKETSPQSSTDRRIAPGCAGTDVPTQFLDLDPPFGGL